MTRYDVLEFHIGDKAYTLGDTRLADASEVAHLVERGLLREADDQGHIDAPSAPPAPDTIVADLSGQVEVLTQERADAIAELSTLRTLHQDGEGQVAQLKNDLAAMTQERDGAIAELQSVKADPRLTNKMDPAPANKAGGFAKKGSN